MASRFSSADYNVRTINIIRLSYLLVFLNGLKYISGSPPNTPF